MRIKEFCEKSGLSRDTVRFYEKRGLLSPRIGENRYREYGAAEMERVAEVELGQMMGFTLREIEMGIRAWKQGELSLKRKMELMEGKLGEVRGRIAQLKTMERYLTRKLAWMQGGEKGKGPAWSRIGRSA